MGKYLLMFLAVISSNTFANNTKVTISEADMIYSYMFPLMVSYTTRDILTNVSEPKGTNAPINQLASAKQLLNASFKEVVKPNADTLYSVSFIDTTTEPMVLSLPAIKDRYFLVPFLDEYGNSVGSFGTRTGETDATTYVIVGSNYKQKLPVSLKNAKVVRLTSNFTFMILRVQVFGESDVKNVNKLQEQFTLVPLSAYGNPNYVPPKGVVNPKLPKGTPNTFIFGLNAKDYYNKAFTYYNQSSLSKTDSEFTRLLAKKGIVHGKTTSFDQLSPEVQKELTDSVTNIRAVYNNYITSSSLSLLAPIGFYPTNKDEIKFVNGWLYFPQNTAVYGKDYVTRSLITLTAYGSNLSKDAVYPIVMVDINGQPLVGHKKYMLTIQPNEQKAARAFWSITMYQNDLFVANPFNRYVSSSWMPLKKNANGSITIYIQNSNPGKDKEANWLPSPKSGNFSLMARLYWPSNDFLEGTIDLPAVIEVN